MWRVIEAPSAEAAPALPEQAPVLEHGLGTVGTSNLSGLEAL